MTSVTHNRNPVFKDKKAAWFLIHTLAYHKFIYDYSLYAFVIMLDHFHAIIQPSRKYNISVIMHHVKGTFARKYNEINNKRGRIWQESFHDRIIRGTKHIRRAIGYTHGNPVRAGLVDSVKEYPFSSYWPLRGGRSSDRFIVDHFE